MARKIVLFWTILGLIFVIANYHFLEQKQPEKAQKEITIFTLDTLAEIHAKMILWNRWTVTALGSSKKLTEAQKKADIIIDTTTLEKSVIHWEIQQYTWTYIAIPELSTIEILHETETLSKQINSIRDGIVEKDTWHPGYYYDSAGNYLHLIESLYETIQTRLSKYHKAKFVTLGGDFDNFIEKFWLVDYHTKHYKTLSDFMKNGSFKELTKTEKINHIFVFFPMTDPEVRKIENLYHVTVYRLPQIEEDTSAWGYLRYVEKVADQFVRAFDTYD